MYEKEVSIGILLLMVLGLFFYGTPFAYPAEPEDSPIINFDDLRDAVDSMENIQDHIDALESSLNTVNDTIDELKDTDWVVKYELVKSELEQERDNQPSMILVIYGSGFLAFSMVFAFTWMYRNKEYSDLKKKNKNLEKENKKLEVIINDRNKEGK